MHELGIAQGIVAVTLDVAGDRNVNRVRVSIGALQRVVLESLEMGFQLCADGTPAAGAVLEVITVPARVQCRECSRESEVSGGVFVCSSCGSSAVTVVAGEGISVDEIEIGGDAPLVVRRPGLEVTEAEGDHHHGDVDEAEPGRHVAMPPRVQDQ